MSVQVSVLTFVVGITGCASTPPLHEAVLPVLREQAAISRVWPGYWSDEQAFLIYKMSENALLYTPAAPPPAYRRLESTEDSKIPEQFQDRLYFHEGVPAGLNGMFDTSYTVGEVTATAVKQELTVSETLITLFHETFHAYQDKHFADTSVGSYFVDPEYVTPSLAAKAEVERRLLQEALQEDNPDRLRNLAREYLALRTERDHEVPEKVHKIELNLERSEGSAALVGLQAAAASLNRSPEYVTTYVRQRLLGTPLKNFRSTIQDRMFRWRLYGTGAAIGLLLDRFETENWRERLEGGESFETLLAEAVRFDAVSDPQALAQRALDRLDFKSILQSRDSLWGSTEAPTIESFYDTPASIVIIFPTEAETFSGGFSGSLYTLAENLTLIKAHLFSADITGFSLTVHDRNVLQDMRTTARIVVALPTLPEVEGLPATSNETTLRTLTLDSEGLEIRATRPVEVSTAPDSIIVRIIP